MTPQEAADLLAAHLPEWNDLRPHARYLPAEDLADKADADPVALRRALEAAARKNLVVRSVRHRPDTGYGYGRIGRKVAQFTTLAQDEAERAERNLDDSVRAERGHAYVLAQYDYNKAEGSDDYWHWHVTGVGFSRLGNDISCAVTGGLVKSTYQHGSNYYVPAERWDAYEAATEAHKARQQAVRDRVARAEARLIDLAGEPDYRGPTVNLSLGRAEAIIALLEAARETVS